ncbi:hypothetical protein K7432_006099 [Basidiobolus ranarum]|uniref:REM-1 domain-containing protein n=1 Tax=Basidiobolus ranarum TaxID=34480 RepID=A0ABR2WVP5_9FUNG
MFVHKNSQTQTSTPSALTRSDYVKTRHHDPKESSPISVGEGNSEQSLTSNTDDVCFTSYSSFTVKPKSIKPMDLRALQACSLPHTPEKKLFSHLNVSTLVSPVASLFNTERKMEGSKHSEVNTIRGPRYDTMVIHEGDTSTREESNLLSRKSTDFPRPSIDAILESFHSHSHNNEMNHEMNHEMTDEEIHETHEEHYDQILEALSDTEQFRILNLTEYRLLKQDYVEHSIAIENLRSKLEQEMKFREGASAMVSVQTDKKLLEQAKEELSSSERKVNQLSSELWRVSQTANLLERKCLEHVAGVLARSIRQESMDSLSVPASAPAPAPPKIQVQSNSTADVSINDISDMCTQLNNMSYQLNAFVKAQIDNRSVNHSNSNMSSDLTTDSRPTPTSNDQDPRVPELMKQIEKLQEELRQSKAEKLNSTEPIHRGRKKRVAKQHLPMPGLEEEGKDQTINQLSQRVNEGLLDISQLNEEKQELLSSLNLIYHRVPDLSLSRDSSISSKASEDNGFDIKKFGQRIDILIQENHRLLDRVVKLQHQNQYAKLNKDNLQGTYSSGNTSFHSWIEDSSSDDGDSLKKPSSMNYLGASLQNQSL